MDDTNGIDVLMVEDSEEDLQLTLRSFKKANFPDRVQVVQDGGEALDYDLNLPRITGLEVLQRIKSNPRTRRIPVVVLTSSKEHRDVLAGYENGANSYIVKPVAFEGFAKAMQELGMYWLVLNNSPKT